MFIEKNPYFTLFWVPIVLMYLILENLNLKSEKEAPKLFCHFGCKIAKTFKVITEGNNVETISGPLFLHEI